MNHPLPPKPGGLPNTQQANATPAASYFTNSGGYQSTAYNNPAQWGWHNGGVPIVAHGTQAANRQALSYPYDFDRGAGTVFGVPYGPNSAGPSRPNGGRPPPGLNGAGTYGTHHCGQPGCHFRGSFKEVQTHKMDRHLIYPPGWKDKKRKRTDLDDDDATAAEEELAAKRAGLATITGTTMVLDTPDAIQAWIAERKKRFPTAQRVVDKKQALEETIKRGQIVAPTDNKGKMRSSDNHRGRGRGRGGDRGRGRGRGGRGRGGRGRGRGGFGNAERRPDFGARDRDSSTITANPPIASTSTYILPLAQLPTTTALADYDSGSGSDIDPINDALSSRPPVDYLHEDEEQKAVRPSLDEAPQDLPEAERTIAKPPRKKAVQPKRPPRAPFSQRPSLLRNLLMSDIQSTVSNLSQAIRFLVANDFLEDVELKPGDAANPRISIIENNSEKASGGDAERSAVPSSVDEASSSRGLEAMDGVET